MCVRLYLHSERLPLVCMIVEFNPKSLDGQEVTLNGDHSLDIDTNQDTEKIYEWKAQSSTTQQQVSVLVPSSKPGQLKPGPCLQGSVSVQQSVAVPEVTLPPPHTHSVEKPRGLKQRWKPFGWREPLSHSSGQSTKKSSRKKRKKHSSTD